VGLKCHSKGGTLIGYRLSSFELKGQASPQDRRNDLQLAAAVRAVRQESRAARPGELLALIPCRQRLD